jgi:threonine dehydrogenase-like Zn-dependent dehydrogenase
MMITWRETYSYVKRMGIDDGARVLVIGTGGNGLAFCAHARNRGAAHIAAVGSAARLEVAGKAGAHTALDYRSASVEQDIANDGAGYDYVIDAVGTRGSLRPALPALASNGTIGIYGIEDRGEVHIDPTRVPGTFTVYQGHYDEAEVHEEVLEMFLDGRLDASLWLDLDHPYALDRIGAAYEMLKRREAVKALIKLSAE